MSTNNASPQMNLASAFKDMFSKSPCLPQNADPAQKLVRQLEVKDQQLHYRYTYESNVPQAPLLDIDPVSLIKERPTGEWLQLVVAKLLEIYGSVTPDVTQKIVGALHDPEKLKELIEMIVPKTFDLRPETISSYDKPFGDEKFIPTVKNDYQMDAAFGRWRLTGPNPLTIEPCTQDILDTKANLASLDDETRDRIGKALTENRLFVCDYSELATIKNGMCGKHEKFSVGPLALFEIPIDEKVRKREWLTPIAIQCNRIDQTPKPPMFTPKDGIKWQIAKTVCNSADSDLHETIFHLAYTHLTVEPFIVGTHRSLPSRHPLRVLLQPHFEGTHFINHLAERTLVNPGGNVDVLASQDIYELERYIGKRVVDILGKDFTFPQMIERRNMGKDRFSPTFPYRDDGILIWEAIRAWVEDYLRVYYGRDDQTATKNIQDDYELQNWVKELREGGRVGWLNGFNDTMKMLADVVAAVIFTSSAQHAAMNFPQDQIQSYVPAFPLAIYKDPKDIYGQAPATEQDLLDTLPPMESAFAQRKVTQLLGGIYYTKLGQYNTDYFVDKDVYPALEKFRETLSSAGQTMEERNQERVANWDGIINTDVAKNWAYTFLLPDNIPQSTNI